MSCKKRSTYLLSRVLCRTIVATCGAHSGVNDAEVADDSACDKDDKPLVWRSVSRYCNSQNFVNSARTPVSLPAEVLENSLHKYKTHFMLPIKLCVKYVKFPVNRSSDINSKHSN